MSVDSGKYTFIRREDGTIDVLRHGEPWLQRCMPQGGIQSLMFELDAARVVVQAAREAVDAPTLRRKEFLQHALAHHDRLVDDRTPPSEWCAIDPEQVGPAETAAPIGIHDLVYEIASDVLAGREPK
ncbi:MAG TPA: hypothetical protein VFT22_01295 [Kofleriaceae bacterium]|nr:hypothetical protein [Kofleriaceae bacterium]